MTGSELKLKRKNLGRSLKQASIKALVSSRTWCRWEKLIELPKRIEILALRGIK